MKKLFLFCIFLISINAYAQKSFERIIELDSTYTRDKIYDKAIEWITLNFKSANDVIQMQDKPSGKIIAKCIINTAPHSGFYGPLSKGTNCTIQIAIKDSKLKMMFTNFSITYYHPPTQYTAGYFSEILYESIVGDNFIVCGKKCKSEYETNLDAECNSLINSLTVKIKSTAVEDTW